MTSLESLRKELLRRLNIEPENITTMATNGTIINHYRRPGDGQNDALRLDYTGEIFIREYGGDVEAVAYIIGQWLHRNQPGHENNCCKFDIEILDNSKYDMWIKIEDMYDRYIAGETPKGTALKHAIKVPADPIAREAGIVEIIPHCIPSNG